MTISTISLTQKSSYAMIYQILTEIIINNSERAKYNIMYHCNEYYTQKI